MSRHPSEVRRSLPLITLAGCLVMLYVTATNSPVFTDFMRSIGAREVHFGLLGGIPLIMLSCQFVGAYITNHVRSRKRVFMTLAITGRLLYLPIALLPIVFPRVSREVMVPIVIGLIAVNSGISNMIGPPWFSWMADLIPRRILNRYWGHRQRAMYLTWTCSFIGVVALAYLTLWPAIRLFPFLAVFGVGASIVDILLFIRVHEPPNTVLPPQPLLGTILAPLRNRDYRSFVLFSCYWSAVCMFSAAFMQIYVLKVLKLAIWQATLIWCSLGLGVALSSRMWGRMADRYGHRPILMFCMFVKPLIVLVFLLITPRSVLWVLPAAFLVDSMWNAAIMVASNGYMLKTAPAENRSMYIAAITGLAGICGGLGAMAGGLFLERFSGFSAHVVGRDWNNYQLLFLLDIFLRFSCLFMARRIREPESSGTGTVVHALWGLWPMRFILFPVGLYRLWNKQPPQQTGGAEPDGLV